MYSDEPILVLHQTDDVAVALQPLAPGQRVQGLIIHEAIAPGHKIARVDLPKGTPVHKYGHVIGVATVPIHAGQWVHTHNLHTGLEGEVTYRYEPSLDAASLGDETSMPATFLGYRRPDGAVGIRNTICIINTVGCVNKTAARLAQMTNATRADEGVDEFDTFPHPYGCSPLGDDLAMTEKILADLVHHPNSAGLFVLGLGCENNQIPDFPKVIGSVPSTRVPYLTGQAVEDEWTVGVKQLAELARLARTFQRVPIPLGELRVSLKCGGFHGFSGITANPLVGLVSDPLAARGATTLLIEVPEMFGGETILMNRAKDVPTCQQIVALINDFKEYYVHHGEVIHENPSPGNKAGGTATLEEKSLGCIQKGGTSPVMGVASSGESVQGSGLHLVQSPGNDAVSVTALVATGAQLVLFTPGRKTPFGGPVPTLKIATNSELARSTPGWIDFNVGALLEGEDRDQLADQLLRQIVVRASGEQRTRNEEHGFREIAIFKDGVTLSDRHQEAVPQMTPRRRQNWSNHVVGSCIRPQ
jgi:altronate hydrolase